MRAVALLAIFVVHADIGRASGAFLAVSTFFTLSGFLITSLLLIEHANKGQINLKAFWGRRVRRLLPASLVFIALIVIATGFIGDAGQISRLKGDAIGALAYVANWRFIFHHDQYGAGFEGQPPLLHFWSLAIEEQYYLLFPLLCVAAFGWGRRWKHAPLAVLGGATVASLLAGIIGSLGHPNTTRLYFGTDVRAAELLVGALAALWWVPRRHRLSDVTHRVIQVLGAVALVAMLTGIATAHFQDLFWYRGGLLAYACVTVLVVLAGVEATGPVRALLSWRPLVSIGVVSYGAYLVHWPTFIWLRSNTSLPGWGRLVVGTVLSIAIAFASYRLIERPVREKRRFTLPVLLGSGAVLIAIILIGAVVVVPSYGKQSHKGTLDTAQHVVTDHIKFTLAKPGEAPRIGVFGDSTGLVNSLGLTVWDDTHRDIRDVGGWAALGCSITSPAMVFDVESNQTYPTPPLCDNWLQHWNEALATPLDVAYLEFGPWEVHQLKAAGMTDFEVVGNPTLDAIMEKNLRAGLDELLRHVKVVVIATSPYITWGRLNGHDPTVEAPESDHARMDRVNAIIRRVAASYPRVAVLDLSGYLAHLKPSEEHRLRPDGVHFSNDTAIEFANLLGPTLAYLAPPGSGTNPRPTKPLLPILQMPRP